MKFILTLYFILNISINFLIKKLHKLKKNKFQNFILDVNYQIIINFMNQNVINNILNKCKIKLINIF